MSEGGREKEREDNGRGKGRNGERKVKEEKGMGRGLVVNGEREVKEDNRMERRRSGEREA